MKSRSRWLHSSAGALLSCGVLLLASSAFSRDGAFVWGINDITLQLISNAVPSAAEILTNPSAVSLNRFYRAGGISLPATPTECRITYDRDALFAVFRCQENDLAFPVIQRKADWYSLIDSPAEQDAEFPDKVDLFIQPDMGSHSHYQFAVTMDGLKFGCKRQDDSAETGESGNASARVEKINTFEAAVSRGTNEWIVFLRIPWKTLGGKPESYFGLLPTRNRWRNGEVSSPVAFDFTDRPPTDLLIETHFSAAAQAQGTQASLCQLPSGTLRWQKPALLTYPDAETVQEVWQMEQSLTQPTDKTNFAQRLYLARCWIDLLTLEGFNFRSGIGLTAEKGMEPHVVRREINAALRSDKMPQACQLLDIFLHQLDKRSRDWFADGSPGNILRDEWKPVAELDDVELQGNVLLMRGRAGDHKIGLQLSLPATGGIRIHGDNEGYFKPASLLPLHATRSSNSFSVKSASGKIIVNLRPFTITLYNAIGTPATEIGPNNLAFRFNQEGKIAAVDFKNQLGTNEAIYGFGEKYDHFNEAGNVLTLWGMDDWLGNTVGLRNQSYKPIPIFHSSKGYMVFDNSTYRLRADIGKTDPNQYRLTQQGPIFDYYFWIGPPKEALPAYTALTGKPVLPPKWAFEPWLGRTGRGWNKPSHNPVAEEEDTVKHVEKLDIPHSAIYSEGSGADSAGLNAFMSARGIKVLSWFYPVIGKSSQASLMPELAPAELPLLRADSADIPWELVDFTNPNALELCRRWWKHRLDIGVAGSMVDFGDNVPEDAVFYGGKRGDEMHNFYSYDYHRTYAETFREKRGNDFILFGRAAAPGTQKFVAQFGGDHPSNFAGLQAVLTGALNLCACGFSTWGSDLGGFLGWPEPSVYMRWTQFACFSPLMRCHGRTPREPWNYGEAAVANYKYHAWVRENLLDYIYNAAIEANQTGVPIMRSLAVAFPNAPSLAAVNGQYMFGNDLLVAPVISENDFKTVSFPAGKWTSLWTGEIVAGPTNFAAYVSLDRIPVYLKPGAAVPVNLNSNLQFGESMSSSKIKALIVTPPDEKSSWTDAQNGRESARLEPKANGFVVSLNQASEINYVLVYGATAVKAVKIDGDNLPGVSPGSHDSTAGDWRIDSTIHRLIIRLPHGQSLRARVEVQLRPNHFK